MRSVRSSNAKGNSIIHLWVEIRSPRVARASVCHCQLFLCDANFSLDSCVFLANFFFSPFAIGQSRTTPKGIIIRFSILWAVVWHLHRRSTPVCGLFRSLSASLFDRIFSTDSIRGQSTKKRWSFLGVATTHMSTYRIQPKILILSEWNSIFRLAFAVICCKFIIWSKIEHLVRQTIQVDPQKKTSIPTKHLRKHKRTDECEITVCERVFVVDSNSTLQPTSGAAFGMSIGGINLIGSDCTVPSLCQADQMLFLSFYLRSTTIAPRRAERKKNENSREIRRCKDGIRQASDVTHFNANQLTLPVPHRLLPFC